jgi:hypothetical protein
MPQRLLTQEDVKRIALSLPEAHEGGHMGHADLRVRNRVFASLPADRGMVAIKASAASLDALVQSDPETFRDVWGGRWVGVRLDRVTAAVVRDLLVDAWRLTAPRGLVSSMRPRPAR